MATNPRTAFEDALTAERVVSRADRDIEKQAANAATVKVFLTIMTSYCTQFDQKLQAKQPNIYRLGHYLEGVQRAEGKLKAVLNNDDAEAMEDLKSALRGSFNADFPPLKRLMKSIDAWVNDKKLPKLGKM